MVARFPIAQAGEPGSFVRWSLFSNDLQLLADTKRPTADFLERLAMVEAREKASEELTAKYGVTEPELKVLDSTHPVSSQSHAGASAFLAQPVVRLASSQKLGLRATHVCPSSSSVCVQVLQGPRRDDE